MKKILLTFPLLLFSYYYPFNYQFKFIHVCMQNSSLPNKYDYCRCIFDKIKNRYPYDYFIWHQTDPDILQFIKGASEKCIKK